MENDIDLLISLYHNGSNLVNSEDAAALSAWVEDEPGRTNLFVRGGFINRFLKSLLSNDDASAQRLN